MQLFRVAVCPRRVVVAVYESSDYDHKDDHLNRAATAFTRNAASQPR